ncbi:Hypothetical protein MAGb_0040 [Mycoplasmopsis agalactiae 14628]|uniref:Uncharacterized protein n=1 Tax=Mycoplasmopsis agalactiae 14628 TaxID=1110504 RepID=I5D717_MYCAA|nr:hypothetical protein [Mycoplasmopsis agalactiae]EIN15476.1 Hypothetical protein MAGb_0040 [Mycoplasmopsis agalactiae 14628]
MKTEVFNLKGIAKVVVKEKAKTAVYSAVENTVSQKKDKKKEKEELQKQQEQIKQHNARVAQFAKENNLTHLSHEEQLNMYWESLENQSRVNFADKLSKEGKNTNSMLLDTVTKQSNQPNVGKGTNATT